MKIKEYEFNNLKILQDTDKQLVSVDSLLLDSFIKINRKTKKVLEIGCGCGIISLLLMKKSIAHVYSIDIDLDMINLTKENFLLNYDKLKSKNITLIHGDIKSKYLDLQIESFDFIFSNPPYFKIDEESQMKTNESLKRARNEINLSIEDIFSISYKLLKNNSKLFIIFRADRTSEILTLAEKYRLTPKRLQFVYTTSNFAKFTLLECVKNYKTGLLIEKPIFLYDENNNKSEFLNNLYKR